MWYHRKGGEKNYSRSVFFFFSGVREEEENWIKPMFEANWPVSWKNEPFRSPDSMDDWLPLSFSTSMDDSSPALVTFIFLIIVECFFSCLVFFFTLGQWPRMNKMNGKKEHLVHESPFSILWRTPTIWLDGIDVNLWVWSYIHECRIRRKKEEGKIDVLWSVQWIWTKSHLTHLNLRMTVHVIAWVFDVDFNVV